MATTAGSIRADSQAKVALESRKQALCTIFDLMEDALEHLTPEQRKLWLDDLSATAEKLEKQV